MSAMEDGNAGHPGLSSRPASEKAKTAVGAGDKATELDRHNPEQEADSYPTDQTLQEDDSISPPVTDRMPLFAHECFDGQAENASAVPTVYTSFQPEADPVFDGVEDIDLNDPTLERFPSNKEDIMVTVRKMETSLNEDQTSCEGVPPSPVIGQSRDVDEAYGIALSSSPWASPVTPRSSGGRLGVPRSPRSSVGSDRAPGGSLSAIAETEERGDAGDGQGAPDSSKASTANAKAQGHAPLESSVAKPSD